MKRCLILLFLILTGCASHTAVMKNAETGDVKTCQTDTALAYSAADLYHRAQQNKCVKELKKAGYKRVK